jgi:hypothetical protein
MIQVKPGSRIRLLAMPDDPDPIPAGSEGVVIEVTDGPLAQIVVEWIGLNRSLALVPGVDVFEIIEPACLESDGEQPQ